MFILRPLSRNPSQLVYGVAGAERTGSAASSHRSRKDASYNNTNTQVMPQNIQQLRDENPCARLAAMN
jgi:hypothetical protein